MADQQVQEMISAFASGCIDKDNFRNFKEYLKSGSDLPLKEMGEVQNVVSLIPIILDEEIPSPEIKGKVAKELKGLKSEIIAKIREKKNQTPNIEEKLELQTVTKEETESKLEQNKKDSYTKQELRKSKTEFSDIKYDVVGQTKEFDEPLMLQSERRKNDIKVKPFFTTGGILSSILLFLLLIAGLYFIHNEVSELHEKNAKLRSEVADLILTQNESQRFITNYKKLISFISYKDISVVRMLSGNDNFNGSAKLMLSFESGEALLELDNIPAPEKDSVYKLWIIGKRESYDVGSFTPNADDRFIELSGLPFMDKSKISLFRITVEENSDVEVSRGRMLLYGALKN